MIKRDNICSVGQQLSVLRGSVAAFGMEKMVNRVTSLFFRLMNYAVPFRSLTSRFQGSFVGNYCEFQALHVRRSGNVVVLACQVLASLAASALGICLGLQIWSNFLKALCQERVGTSLSWMGALQVPSES